MRKPVVLTSFTFLPTLVLLALSLASGGITVIRDVYFVARGIDAPRSTPITTLEACSVLAAWFAWWHLYRVLWSRTQRPDLTLDCWAHGGDTNNRVYNFCIANQNEVVAVNVKASDICSHNSPGLRLSFDLIPNVAKDTGQRIKKYSVLEGDSQLHSCEAEWFFRQDIPNELMKAKPYTFSIEFENLDRDRWRADYRLCFDPVGGDIAVEYVGVKLVRQSPV